MPFIKDIRKWVASQRRQRSHRRDSHRRLSTQSTTSNPQRYLSLNYTICLSGPPSYVRPAILEVIQWLQKCWINYPKLRLRRRIGLGQSKIFQVMGLPQWYSMVPNNSAARLLIFKIFFLPTRLIWTYTLIKIQIIFLPTRLLSTIFYFLIYFQYIL